ncbi:hypothetical protein EJB05_49796 [Eragrostis curvula]|uniref:Uncharacterized protein n=1 Tax=Eragrostis curvula TaxID=38414 RepID=A0A5J9T5E3_9POAL|nr:hypothetical protein EJB05_49796 [Eragrostis curvula]
MPTTAEDDGTCDSVQRSSGRRSGSGGTKITGGGAAAPVSEAAMTEAGGVLDPFSAFIPMRISSTSKLTCLLQFRVCSDVHVAIYLFSNPFDSWIFYGAAFVAVNWVDLGLDSWGPWLHYTGFDL